MHVAVLCLLVIAADGGRSTTAIPKVADDRLTLELIAAEPDIVTPTGAAVDSKGRVYVVESHTHFRPKDYDGPPADRIRLFTMTGAKGKPATVSNYFEGTVFTMNIGITEEDDVYVATRQEIFRLRDKDGDGKADERTRIAWLQTKGNYPHNGLSGFAFDPFGNVVFGFGENLGADYKLIGSDGTTLSGGGEGGNIYRCRLDGSKLERVATGYWNPFHVAFDSFGRLFAVDNDPDSRPPCRLLHIVEGGDYGYRYRNGRKGVHPFTAWNGELPGTLPMLAGTGEAPSGVLAYESDNLPAEYVGSLLVTSWGDHRIERYTLTPNGATLRSATETIVVGDENFRPVGIAQAPDGSVYFSDWVDKSYDLHKKGRLWRLAAKRPASRQQAPADAVAIEHPDRRIREDAARRLAASPDGIESLRRAVRSSGSPYARATALDALVRKGAVNEEVAKAALSDRDDRVRAASVRALPRKLVDVASFAANDPSAMVRAEALRRCETGDPDAPLLAALQSSDAFLQQAARQGFARAGKADDVIALTRSKEDSLRVAGVLMLRRLGDPRSLELMPAFLADPNPDVRYIAVEWTGESRLKQFNPRLLENLARPGTTRALFGATLASLELLAGIRREQKDEIGMADYAAPLFVDPKSSAAVKRLCLQMIPADHPAMTIGRLEELIAKGDAELQAEAVRTLREHPDAKKFVILGRVADDRSKAQVVRAEAIIGLDAARMQDFARLLSFAAGPDRVLAAEALRSLRGASFSEEARENLAKIENDESLRESIELLVPKSTSQAMPPIDDWERRLEGPSDADAGRRVFFHPRGPGCYRCHQIEGRGGLAGPDLGMTARNLSRRRLIESIVQPSQEIAPHYVPWAIETIDGRVLSGLLLGEELDGTMRFADSKGTIFKLTRDQVSERQPQKTSIMPDDLPAAMTTQEFRDLIAYLQMTPENAKGGKPSQ